MDIAKVQGITQAAMLSAVALALSYLETMIPLPMAVPGIKLGLANLAVIIALYRCSARCAAGVALVKVAAAGLLFGSPMMLAYSACGMALAFACMLALHAPGLDPIPVSIASAICHNAGQLAAATFLLGSWAVFALLPPLAVAACITGALIGVVAHGVLDALTLEGGQRPSVDLAGLEVRPGEHIAFIGANGSGKTSAALQLAGLADTFAARSSVDVAIVFQNPDDQIVKTEASSDVAFGPENAGMLRSRMMPLVSASLLRAGVDDAVGREVDQLSGGKRQGVAVAGALACEPGIIVFDESASMLDAAAREAHRTLVAQLVSAGMGVVTITQHLDEAFEADRIAVFSECAVVAVALPSDLLSCGDVLERSGMELPPVAELAGELRRQGVPVTPTADAEALGRELACLFARS